MGKVYEKEFKIMISELILSGRPVKEVSKEFGLNDSMVRRWRREHEIRLGHHPDHKGISQEEKEIKRLRRELANVKEERDILKKVVGIFSKRDM